MPAQFRTSVRAGAIVTGYGLVRVPTAGPNGITLEFTGQAAVVTRLSGGNPASVISAMRLAIAKSAFWR